MSGRDLVNVFTYGSLMYPAVWERIVRGQYRHEIAKLKGYTRKNVLGEVYPALVCSATPSQLTGRLYYHVDEEDLRRLDIFEGEFYRRICVRVFCEPSRQIQACCYLWREKYMDKLTHQDWDPKHFQEVGLPRFLTDFFT